LRTAARYELRNQTGGLAQLITVGAAGRLGDGITTLARFQSTRSKFEGRENSSLQGTAALALRPLKSDRAALLFSYTHRSLTQGGIDGLSAVTDRSDTLSADGLWQPFKDTELYGRVALKFGANSREGLMYASALTYLSQLRVQRTLAPRLRRGRRSAHDGAARDAHDAHVRRRGNRLLGLRRHAHRHRYNFTSATEPGALAVVTQPRGFYFTISTKLSNLFDLFGTAADGLVSASGQEARSGV
jgi:hypothetical protein